MSIPRNLGAFADNLTSTGTLNVGGINATGTPSSTTVLAGNGSWVTPNAGALVYITTVTASNASTVDVETLDSTYDMYMIVAQGINMPSSSSTLNCQTKISGTYQTSGYSYVLSQTNAGATTTSISKSLVGSFIYLGDITSSAGFNCSFVMYISNASSSTVKKLIQYQVTTMNGTTVYNWLGSGAYNAANTAVTGIRFLTNTNTFNGTFRLYGIKNS